jgi:hypothetical protein
MTKMIEIELTVLKRHANRLRLLDKQRERTLPRQEREDALQKSRYESTVISDYATVRLNISAFYKREWGYTTDSNGSHSKYGIWKTQIRIWRLLKYYTKGKLTDKLQTFRAGRVPQTSCVTLKENRKGKKHTTPVGIPETATNVAKSVRADAIALIAKDRSPLLWMYRKLRQTAVIINLKYCFEPWNEYIIII